jgi:hypothetical protein
MKILFFTFFYLYGLFLSSWIRIQQLKLMLIQIRIPIHNPAPDALSVYARVVGSVFTVFGPGSSNYIIKFLSKLSEKRFAVEDVKLSM